MDKGDEGNKTKEKPKEIWCGKSQVIIESNHLKVLVFKCSRIMFLPIIHVRSGEFWAHQAIQKPPSIHKSISLEVVQCNWAFFGVTIPAQLDIYSYNLPKLFVSPKFSNSEFLSAHFGRVGFFFWKLSNSRMRDLPYQLPPFWTPQGWPSARLLNEFDCPRSSSSWTRLTWIPNPPKWWLNSLLPTKLSN